MLLALKEEEWKQEPKNVDSLWRMERARNWILLRSLQEEDSPVGSF